MKKSLHPAIQYSRSTLQSARKDELIDLILDRQERHSSGIKTTEVMFVEEGGSPEDGCIIAMNLQGFDSIDEAVEQERQQFTDWMMDWGYVESFSSEALFDVYTKTGLVSIEVVKSIDFHVDRF